MYLWLEPQELFDRSRVLLGLQEFLAVHPGVREELKENPRVQYLLLMGAAAGSEGHARPIRFGEQGTRERFRISCFAQLQVS